jgi:mycofactocin precursor
MERKTQDEIMETQKNRSEENDVKEDIFHTEEIKVEEMAIDGICGVY